MNKPIDPLAPVPYNTSMAGNADDLLTLSQCAALAGLAPRTLHTQIRVGRLKSTLADDHYGGQYRRRRGGGAVHLIRRGDLDAYIRSRWPGSAKPLDPAYSAPDDPDGMTAE